METVGVKLFTAVLSSGTGSWLLLGNGNFASLLSELRGGAESGLDQFVRKNRRFVGGKGLIWPLRVTSLQPSKAGRSNAVALTVARRGALARTSQPVELRWIVISTGKAIRSPRPISYVFALMCPSPFTSVNTPVVNGTPTGLRTALPPRKCHSPSSVVCVMASAFRFPVPSNSTC